MGTVRKFTFDLDFDAPEEPEKPEPEVEEDEPEEEIPTFSEEEVEQARSEGFDAGKEEGRREAADATEQKLLETVEAACGKLGEIYNTQTEANREIGREMISVATAIAKKMFPDLNARNALGEVERVVQETLKAVTEEPRIQIMVNPELREPLTERLGTMTHRAGFEGKVFVNPDPAMQLGDCRIEWSNGAAVRDVEEMWQMIDKIINENLHDALEDDDTDETGEAASAPAEDTTPEPEPAPEPETEQEPLTDETARGEPEAPEPETADVPAAEAVPDDTDAVADASPAEDMAPDTLPDTEPETGNAQAPIEEEPATAPESAEPTAPDSDAGTPDPGNAADAEAPSLTGELQTPPEAGDETNPSGPGADTEEVDAFETPSWQDAVGESTGLNAPIEPAPEPEPEPAPAAETPDDTPEAPGPGAHGPSFAPSIDDGEIPAQTENNEVSQDVSMENRAAPIPHLDGEPGAAGEAGGDAADGEPASPPYSDPDPVSSTTQAAILDAQGALDDDDENPSGG
ncbi:MAG: FliH/SctL family protein [Rhodospirillales bacterium]